MDKISFVNKYLSQCKMIYAVLVFLVMLKQTPYQLKHVVDLLGWPEIIKMADMALVFKPSLDESSTSVSCWLSWVAAIANKNAYHGSNILATQIDTIKFVSIFNSNMSIMDDLAWFTSGFMPMKFDLTWVKSDLMWVKSDLVWVQSNFI